MIPVRQALTFGDAAMICDLTRRMVAVAPHGELSDFSMDETWKHVLSYVQRPKEVGCFLCDGGFILGRMVKPYYNGKREFVQEFAWHAGRRGGRELLEALAEWGKGRGAVGIAMSQMEHEDPVKARAFQRAFRDLGYRPVERSYFMAFEIEGGGDEHLLRPGSERSSVRRHR